MLAKSRSSGENDNGRQSETKTHSSHSTVNPKSAGRRDDVQTTPKQSRPPTSRREGTSKQENPNYDGTETDDIPHGRCSRCAHCARIRENEKKKIVKAGFIIDKLEDPPTVVIDMDQYDVDGYKKQQRNNSNGRTTVLDGDIEKYLQRVIETPFTSTPLPPKYEASRTPYPEYDVLQRREIRLNKPYTTTLFLD
ncbi:unnamed protein product [Didymodactylos carnosus]|nr:unnamed protein product [Didymodactylos carnosus]